MSDTPAVMVNGEPNPTGTGRYCAPNRCYCRTCPSYVPPDPDAYMALVRKARRELAEKADRKFRR